MGKGDNRRPTQVSDQAFTNNWCATMGHKARGSSKVCSTCGQRITRKKAKHVSPRINQDVD